MENGIFGNMVKHLINEAFNQGLPVIASTAVGAAVGGLVEDGINGYIFPERDSNALANSLTKLLSDDVFACNYQN